jgi:cobalamin biosynthesis Mg chelatase CobN
VEGKEIDLDQIDHSKINILEALGISKEELERAAKERSLPNAVKNISNIFSPEELREALEKSLTISEVITYLWKKKGRTRIKVEEALATLIVLKELEKLEKRQKEEEELRDIVRMVLLLLFKDERLAFFLAPVILSKIKEEKERLKKIVTLVKEREEGEEDEELTFIKVDLIREIEGWNPIVHPDVRPEFEAYVRNWKEKTIQKILEAKSIGELKKALLSP